MQGAQQEGEQKPITTPYPIYIPVAMLQGGGKYEFKWNFVKFKERLTGKKRVMEHHQTVARPHNGTPGCSSSK